MGMRDKKKLAPLRKVLGLVTVWLSDVDSVEHELYECGHHAPRKQDIYGPTNAYRRRCHSCAAGKEPDGEALAVAKEWLAKEKRNGASE